MLIAEDRARSKLGALQHRLDSQRKSDDVRRQRAAPMTLGKIKKVEADLEQRLAKIRGSQNAQTAQRPIAGGVIIITE